MVDSIRSLRTRRALLAGFLVLLAISLAACTSQTKGASYNFRWYVTYDSIFAPDGSIISGLWLTIAVSVVAQILGVALGILAALAKMARIWPFRIVSNLYVWFFRGTPLIVQLSFLFYGIQTTRLFMWPLIDFGPVVIAPEVVAGTVILGINEGAYMAEIVRAGILAVDPGQTEAAKSLGMTYSQTMRRIVLPQAARVIIPPLGNEFNNMLKNTSLLSALSIFELYYTFSSKANTTLIYFEYMIACCFWYLLLTTIWGFVQAWIERRFSKGTTTSSAGPGWRERLLAGRRRQQAEEIAILGGH
jgi:polar amino acid transport system permease protein